MNFFDNNLSWQAHNLPEGLSLNDGVLSGTPTVAGAFDIPVTVSNSLGSDTKNIHINIIDKEIFPIFVNDVETEAITIPQLQEMIRSGEAQSKFNCSNTYMLIYMLHPRHNSIVPYVRLNFCQFREFSLQDGVTKNGLILQFHHPLWKGLAPFDLNNFNRWKYSHLRRWLNSSGDNWFSHAYQNDNPDVLQGSYLDNVPGFLDFLPQVVVDALKPVKINTLAFFDDFNDDPAIDDPDFASGKDFDTTFDKVFIPSIAELNFNGDSFEGSAWDFYSINSLSEPHFRDLDGNTCSILTRSAFIEAYDKVCVVDDNLNVSHILASSSIASPAPAFVLY